MSSIGKRYLIAAQGDRENKEDLMLRLSITERFFDSCLNIVTFFILAFLMGEMLFSINEMERVFTDYFEKLSFQMGGTPSVTLEFFINSSLGNLSLMDASEYPSFYGDNLTSQMTEYRDTFIKALLLSLLVCFLNAIGKLILISKIKKLELPLKNVTLHSDLSYSITEKKTAIDRSIYAFQMLLLIFPLAFLFIINSGLFDPLVGHLYGLYRACVVVSITLYTIAFLYYLSCYFFLSIRDGAYEHISSLSHNVETYKAYSKLTSIRLQEVLEDKNSLLWLNQEMATADDNTLNEIRIAIGSLLENKKTNLTNEISNNMALISRT